MSVKDRRENLLDMEESKLKNHKNVRSSMLNLFNQKVHSFLKVITLLSMMIVRIGLKFTKMLMKSHMILSHLVL